MRSTLPKLLIIGAGGFARETAEAVHALNADQPTWNLVGYLDDDPALVGHRIQGVEVLGPLSMATAETSTNVVICTGRPDNYFSRKRIVRQLSLPDDRYATIVHPAASLGSSTCVGPGSVLLAGVIATASVTIGRHVAVMPGTIFTHDDEIEDFCTVASGARLGGSVHACEGSYLGAGCLIRESLRIGEWSLVGMGAVVTRDVPPAEVWAGVPARRHSTVSVPPDLLLGL
ncbi:MAG: acetyltransferase [Acidimicrobiaceae bacterium]|nr:acetyltransferase [Acidimicrobiaceae bacterium]